MVCASCLSSLPSVNLSCEGDAAGHEFDAIFARYEYRFPVDRLVQRFKYAGDLAIGKWLSMQLALGLCAAPVPQLLVPMPITRARLRERGFNQAVEIARVVSRVVRVPAAPRALERTRDAPPQSGLGRRARRANLRDAFACPRPLGARHVALVDDVVTTGATADAAARVLKRAGVERVDLWALARTPDPKDA
jgi:ComF family protein